MGRGLSRSNDHTGCIHMPAWAARRRGGRRCRRYSMAQNSLGSVWPGPLTLDNVRKKIRSPILSRTVNSTGQSASGANLKLLSYYAPSTRRRPRRENGQSVDRERTAALWAIWMVNSLILSGYIFSLSWYRRGAVRYRRNPRALEARGAIASDLSLCLSLLRSQMCSTGKPKQRLLVARFAH
jgi:hypothetical protein